MPFERIRLLQGDSDELLAGGGTGGSKSIMHSGTAIVEAAGKVIEQGKQIASHVLEASAADIEFSTRPLRHRRHRPRDRHHGAGRQAAQRHQPAGGRAAVARREPRQRRAVPPTFPNGCHVAEVEIDPDTGVVEVVKYTSRQRFRHRHQSADRRGPAARRRGAGHRPGADGAHRLRRATASSSPARSWTTRCRAPPTRRTSRSAIIRCRPRPIRSASRAAAKPAAPARCRR